MHRSRWTAPRRLARQLGGSGRAPLALLLAALLALAAVPGWVPYRIHYGDTLWGLAREHHTTVARLERVNHLHGSLIYAGALLLVPGSEGSARAAAANDARTPTARPARYLVQAGDTVTAIAARFGTTVAAIARANRLGPNDVIDIGQHLVLPGPTRRVSSPARPVAEPAGPWVSPTTVAAVVAATARRLGVPVALALGVAEQESGFQQQVRSVTGAVGVMQVEPATARWLSTVAGRRLDPSVLGQNVYAGVLLLQLLLRVTNEREAVAGYYQGLGSVRRVGLLASTRQYVADVFALAARFR